MRLTPLLLAAAVLALPAPPAPTESLSLPATIKNFAEQTVFEPPTTTTRRRRTTTSKEDSSPTSSASPTNSSPSSQASPSAYTPPLPSLTNPNPNTAVDPATPTNATEPAPRPSVTPQSIIMNATAAGTPGVAVVTEVVTVTASPAGEENGAKIYFPSALNYWVLHAVSVIEWAPALPVPVDIRLTHAGTDVLIYDYILSVNVPAGFTSLALSVMEPASPAKGYQLIIADHGNGTIYSTSEMFEIKEAGSSVLVPAGFAAATQSGGIVAQASGARQATWTTALASAALVAALWL
ncbi:unnamed protein product [Cutaneotrichosporon oleaginosum]